MRRVPSMRSTMDWDAEATRRTDSALHSPLPRRDDRQGGGWDQPALEVRRHAGQLWGGQCVTAADGVHAPVARWVYPHARSMPGCGSQGTLCALKTRLPPPCWLRVLLCVLLRNCLHWLQDMHVLLGCSAGSS
jgi:hypothetical protein